MHAEHEGEGATTGALARCCSIRTLWFAVVANFCNVGAQISTWSSLIPYMKQYTTVSERTAAYYLTGVLVALMVGRFVSTPLMKYVSPSRMLGIYGVANVLLMVVAITRPGWWGHMGVVASGFFCRLCSRRSLRLD